MSAALAGHPLERADAGGIGESEALGPYPGLRSFNENEAHLFFGREEHVDQCLRRLATQRLLAIVGDSGAGKSSLVLAGVLPALRDGLIRPAGYRWRYIVARPGHDPIGSLAAELPRLHAASAENDAKHVARIRARLEADGLVSTIRGLSSGGENVLLVIDQFEELFRLGKGQTTEAEWLRARRQFVQAILDAASNEEVPIYVILTMRSEFIGDCAMFQNLPEALNQGLFLVPRLTTEELELAIISPANVFGSSLGRELVDQKLIAANDLPKDELPLLQHALMRAWRERANRLQLADENGATSVQCASLCDVRAALQEHAEEIYGSLDADAQRAAEVVFRRISLLSADGKATRSPTSLGQLIELAGQRGIPGAGRHVRSAIDAFRASECGFLLPAAPDALDDLQDIDISHEAILRRWPRLQAWLEDERRSGRMYQRLMDAQKLYAANGGPLLEKRSLDGAEQWWKECQPDWFWARRYRSPDAEAMPVDPSARDARDREEFARVEAFLQESLKQEQVLERRAERAKHIKLIVAIVFVVLAAGAVVASARQQASTAEAVANLEALKARDAEKDAKVQSERARAEAATSALEKARADSEKLRADNAIAENKRLEAEFEREKEALLRGNAEKRSSELERQTADLTRKKERLERKLGEAEEEARNLVAKSQAKCPQASPDNSGRVQTGVRPPPGATEKPNSDPEGNQDGRSDQ